MSNISVIILAAGFGSRLMPHTECKPKCMVEIAGKSILERQKELFASYGIHNVSVVTGHACEAVASEGIITFENKDYASTNMVHSLMTAKNWINELSGDLVISYGDIVFNKNVFDVLLNSSEHPISVVVDKNWEEYWSCRMDDPLSDAETLKINDKNLIYEIGKKTKSYQEIQGQYIGLQKWERSAIDKIVSFYESMDKDVLYDGQEFNSMYMTSFLQALIDNNFNVNACMIENGWLEVDTVEDYDIYHDMIEKKTLGKFYDVSEKFS